MMELRRKPDTIVCTPTGDLVDGAIHRRQYTDFEIKEALDALNRPRRNADPDSPTYGSGRRIWARRGHSSAAEAVQPETD